MLDTWKKTDLNEYWYQILREHNSQYTIVLPWKNNFPYKMDTSKCAKQLTIKWLQLVTLIVESKETWDKTQIQQMLADMVVKHKANLSPKATEMSNI